MGYNHQTTTGESQPVPYVKTNVLDVSLDSLRCCSILQQIAFFEDDSAWALLLKNQGVFLFKNAEGPTHLGLLLLQSGKWSSEEQQPVYWCQFNVASMERHALLIIQGPLYSQNNRNCHSTKGQSKQQDPRYASICYTINYLAERPREHYDHK